jgi:hypothetical protein
MSKTIKKTNNNNNNDTKINTDLATKISNLIDHGRKEITTKKELEKFPIGSLISYMTIDGTFKAGGYLYKFGDEWFVFITPDLDLKIRVRYKNVKTLWVADVFKSSGDIVSLSETKQNKTNFPVKIGDVTVFYGRSTFQMKRFMNTEKYKRMIAWYNFFVNT